MIFYKKIFKKIDEWTTFKKLENVFIFIFSLLFFEPLLSGYNFIFNTDNLKNNINVLIAFIAFAFAFSTLFINYSRHYLEKNEHAYKQIRNTVEGLIISSLFPIFVLLFSQVNIKTTFWVKILFYAMIYATIISIYIFTFCIIKLWLITTKNFINRIFSSGSSVADK
jgi:hypothetical protein